MFSGAIRGILTQTLLYALSVALMRGVSLLMLPVVATYLSPEDFGRMEILSSIAIVGSVLVGLGLEDTLFRFAGQSEDEKARRKIAATIFTLTLIVAGIFSLLSFPLASYLSVILPGGDSTYALQLLLFMLALEGAISVPLGWLRMRDRAITFCLLSISRVIIQASFTYYFLSLGKGVDGVFEAGLIAVAFQGFLLGFIQLKETGLAFDAILLRKSLLYSVPLVGSGVLAFGLNGFDRWVIAEYLTMVDVAIYGVAAKFAIAVTILMQPFGMWWTPRRFGELNRPDGEYRVQKFSTLGIMMTIYLILVLGFTVPWLIQFIMPAGYHGAYFYLLGLLVAVGLREITEFVNIGCFKGDSTRVQLLINILSTAIGCMLMISLTRYFDVWGLVLSLVIAYLLRFYLFYFFSQRVVRIHFNLTYIASSFIIVVFMLFLFYAEVLWLDLRTKSALIFSLGIMLCIVTKRLLVDIGVVTFHKGEKSCLFSH